MAGSPFVRGFFRVVLCLFCLFAFARILRAQAGYELLQVESNPQKGFHWPYYPTIPSNLVRPAIIVVEGVNTGTPSDDPKVADSRARQQAEYDASNADSRELGSPFLTPTFPRPANPSLYTHGLDKATLLSKAPGYERIDLQLVAMIDDARPG